MSDNAEEVLEERLGHIQRRAENFRELLREGEEITIACLDGKMSVEESFRSQFERKHAKLFGRMLSIDAQLEMNWSPSVIGLLAGGVFLFGLQLSWWDWLLGEDVRSLMNTWWFFLVVFAVILYLVSVGCGQWRKRIFRRHRAELLALIANEKLDRDVMLVMLRDVSDLDNVVAELKLDPGQRSEVGSQKSEAEKSS
jgi:hypothetical protein